MKSKQLCLFCRNTGLICLEKEGDLGTYVDCGYCDSLSDGDEDDFRENRREPSKGEFCDY